MPCLTVWRERESRLWHDFPLDIEAPHTIRNTETQAARHSRIAHDHPLSRTEPSGPTIPLRRLHGAPATNNPKHCESLLQKVKILKASRYLAISPRIRILLTQGYEKRHRRRTRWTSFPTASAWRQARYKRGVNQDEEKSSEVATLGQVGASYWILAWPEPRARAGERLQRHGMAARRSKHREALVTGSERVSRLMVRSQAARGLTSLSIRRRKVRSATSKS